MGRSFRGKPWQRIIILLALLAILLAGCGGSRQAQQTQNSVQPQAGSTEVARSAKQSIPVVSYDSAKVTAGQKPAPGAGGVTRVGDVRLQRKVIKNADLNMRVPDLDEFVAWLGMRVEALDGIVADARVSGSGIAEEERKRSGSAQLTLRLPAARFGAFLAELEDKGKILNRRIYSEDVTEQYVDLEARIANLKSQEERLRQILGQAQNVQEILSVERELERVRGDLESLSGKLNVLRDRVEFSTITLQVNEEKEPLVGIKTSSFHNLGQRISNSLVASLNGLANLAAGLVVFLAGALPVLVVLAIIAVPAWRLYNRRRPPSA